MKKIILTFFLLCVIGIFAQNNTNKITLLTDIFYEITLKDGTKFKAQIYKESMDSLIFVFRTSLIDTMKIPISSISSIKENKHSDNKKIKKSEKEIATKKEISSQEKIEKPSKTKEWINNPFPSKYFFGVSALPLKKNEIYYQNTLIISNTINFGISNNFSLGVGTLLSENFFYDFRLHAELPYIYITPKLSYKINDFISLGCVSMFNYFNNYDEFFFNFRYFVNGMVTFGNENNNFSLGVGNSNLLDVFDFELRPDITLSGMLRLSNNFFLITDNWLIPDVLRESKYEEFNAYRVFSTTGFRYFREKIAFDFGILNSFSVISSKYQGKNHLYFRDYLIFPYIDIAVKF